MGKNGLARISEDGSAGTLPDIPATSSSYLVGTY
jgi:hypothetical protein